MYTSRAGGYWSTSWGSIPARASASRAGGAEPGSVARAQGPARPGLPTGTVTLLFSDIEGSTRLLHDLGDDYRDLLVAHRRVLRDAVSAQDGFEVDSQGDGHFCVFVEAVQAAGAAAAAQRSFATEQWPGGVELRVRMGLHTGAPSARGDGGMSGRSAQGGAHLCRGARRPGAAIRRHASPAGWQHRARVGGDRAARPGRAPAQGSR